MIVYGASSFKALKAQLRLRNFELLLWLKMSFQDKTERSSHVSCSVPLPEQLVNPDVGCCFCDLMMVM